MLKFIFSISTLFFCSLAIGLSSTDIFLPSSSANAIPLGTLDAFALSFNITPTAQLSTYSSILFLSFLGFPSMPLFFFRPDSTTLLIPILASSERSGGFPLAFLPINCPTLVTIRGNSKNINFLLNNTLYLSTDRASGFPAFGKVSLYYKSAKYPPAKAFISGLAFSNIRQIIFSPLSKISNIPYSQGIRILPPFYTISFIIVPDMHKSTASVFKFVHTVGKKLSPISVTLKSNSSILDITLYTSLNTLINISTPALPLLKQTTVSISVAENFVYVYFNSKSIVSKAFNHKFSSGSCNLYIGESEKSKNAKIKLSNFEISEYVAPNTVIPYNSAGSQLIASAPKQVAVGKFIQKVYFTPDHAFIFSFTWKKSPSAAAKSNIFTISSNTTKLGVISAISILKNGSLVIDLLNSNEELLPVVKSTISLSSVATKPLSTLATKPLSTLATKPLSTQSTKPLSTLATKSTKPLSNLVAKPLSKLATKSTKPLSNLVAKPLSKLATKSSKPLSKLATKISKRSLAPVNKPKIVSFVVKTPLISLQKTIISIIQNDDNLSIFYNFKNVSSFFGIQNRITSATRQHYVYASSPWDKDFAQGTVSNCLIVPIAIPLYSNSPLVDIQLGKLLGRFQIPTNLRLQFNYLPNEISKVETNILHFSTAALKSQCIDGLCTIISVSMAAGKSVMVVRYQTATGIRQLLSPAMDVKANVSVDIQFQNQYVSIQFGPKIVANYSDTSTSLALLSKPVFVFLSDPWTPPALGTISSPEIISVFDSTKSAVILGEESNTSGTSSTSSPTSPGNSGTNGKDNANSPGNSGGNTASPAQSSSNTSTISENSNATVQKTSSNAAGNAEVTPATSSQNPTASNAAGNAEVTPATSSQNPTASNAAGNAEVTPATSSQNPTASNAAGNAEVTPATSSQNPTASNAAGNAEVTPATSSQNPTNAKTNPVGNAKASVDSKDNTVTSPQNPTNAKTKPVGNAKASVDSKDNTATSPQNPTNAITKSVGNAKASVDSKDNTATSSQNPTNAKTNPVGNAKASVDSKDNTVTSPQNPTNAKTKPVGNAKASVDSKDNTATSPQNPTNAITKPVGNAKASIDSKDNTATSPQNPIASDAAGKAKLNKTTSGWNALLNIFGSSGVNSATSEGNSESGSNAASNSKTAGNAHLKTAESVQNSGMKSPSNSKTSDNSKVKSDTSSDQTLEKSNQSPILHGYYKDTKVMIDTKVGKFSDSKKGSFVKTETKKATKFNITNNNETKHNDDQKMNSSKLSRIMDYLKSHFSKLTNKNPKHSSQKIEKYEDKDGGVSIEFSETTFTEKKVKIHVNE